jgi:hypothetical protein
MSGTSSVPIGPSGAEGVAPTPQNTPLTTAPFAAGLSRPTVPTIGEENDEGDDNGSDANGPPQTPPETSRFGDPLKLGAAGQAAMLGMVQARLQGLMGRSSGYIESLPVGTKRKVEALKGVQVKWEELYLQFKLESIELEKKVRSLSCLSLSVPLNADWGSPFIRRVASRSAPRCYPNVLQFPALIVPRKIHPIVRSPCRDHQRLRPAHGGRAQSRCRANP